MDIGWSSAVDDFSFFQDQEFNAPVPQNSKCRPETRKRQTSTPWSAVTKTGSSSQQSLDASHNNTETRPSPSAAGGRVDGVPNSTHTSTQSTIPVKSNYINFASGQFKRHAKGSAPHSTKTCDMAAQSDFEEEHHSTNCFGFDAASQQAMEARNPVISMNMQHAMPRGKLKGGRKGQQENGKHASDTSSLSTMPSSPSQFQPRRALREGDGRIRHSMIPPALGAYNPLMQQSKSEDWIGPPARPSSSITVRDERRPGPSQQKPPNLAHISLKKNKDDKQTRLDFQPVKRHAAPQHALTSKRFPSPLNERQVVSMSFSSADRQDHAPRPESNLRSLWNNEMLSYEDEFQPLWSNDDGHSIMQNTANETTAASGSRVGDRREILYGSAFNVDEEKIHEGIKENLNMFQAPPSSQVTTWSTLPHARRSRRDSNFGGKRKRQDHTRQPHFAETTFRADLPVTPSLGAASKFSGASVCRLRLGSGKTPLSSECSQERRTEPTFRSRRTPRNKICRIKTEHDKEIRPSSDVGSWPSVERDANDGENGWVDIECITISDDDEVS